MKNTRQTQVNIHRDAWVEVNIDSLAHNVKEFKRNIDKGMNPYDNDTKNFSFSKKGVDNGSTKILKSIAKDVVLKLNKKGS